MADKRVVLHELPDDLYQAYEAMKLAILRHRYAKWQEACPDSVVHYLAHLIDMALPPPEHHHDRE